MSSNFFQQAHVDLPHEIWDQILRYVVNDPDMNRATIPCIRLVSRKLASIGAKHLLTRLTLHFKDSQSIKRLEAISFSHLASQAYHLTIVPDLTYCHPERSYIGTYDPVPSFNVEHAMDIQSQAIGVRQHPGPVAKSLAVILQRLPKIRYINLATDSESMMEHHILARGPMGYMYDPPVHTLADVSLLMDMLMDNGRSIRELKLECALWIQEASFSTVADFPHLEKLDIGEQELYDTTLTQGHLNQILSLPLRRLKILHINGGIHPELDIFRSLGLSRSYEQWRLVEICFDTVIIPLKEGREFFESQRESLRTIRLTTCLFQDRWLSEFIWKLSRSSKLETFEFDWVYRMAGWTLDDSLRTLMDTKLRLRYDLRSCGLDGSWAYAFCQTLIVGNLLNYVMTGGKDQDIEAFNRCMSVTITRLTGQTHSVNLTRTGAFRLIAGVLDGDAWNHSGNGCLVFVRIDLQEADIEWMSDCLYNDDVQDRLEEVLHDDEEFMQGKSVIMRRI